MEQNLIQKSGYWKLLRSLPTRFSKPTHGYCRARKTGKHGRKKQEHRTQLLIVRSFPPPSMSCYKLDCGIIKEKRLNVTLLFLPYLSCSTHQTPGEHSYLCPAQTRKESTSKCQYPPSFLLRDLGKGPSLLSSPPHRTDLTP